MVLICLINPYVLIVFIGMIGVLFWLCRYYLRSSRQIKRIESKRRRPIYDLFSSSVNGLSTIRAFKKKNDLIKDLTTRIDRNTNAYLSQKGAAQWFAVRLEYVASLIVFFNCYSINNCSKRNQSIINCIEFNL